MNNPIIIEDLVRHAAAEATQFIIRHRSIAAVVGAEREVTLAIGCIVLGAIAGAFPSLHPSFSATDGDEIELEGKIAAAALLLRATEGVRINPQALAGDVRALAGRIRPE